MKLYESNTGKYNFLMAYPANEEFALASLGYLWLYKIADEMPDINAQMITVDNMNINMRKIDSIAFSISFDFDFTGVFEIMEKLRIPFYKSERSEETPLIFAGGPVITTNPAPYEAFFDFMLLGDGEDAFPKVLEILKESKTKAETLSKLSLVEGIYTGKGKVKKASAHLDNVIYTPIISDKSYFKDTFIVEISRGCTNRCAFCTASYTNLPYRFQEYSKITEAIELGLKHTNKIALLGAQISAHPKFEDILVYINKKMDAGVDIELSFSSLRVDAIKPYVVQTLVRGGQKSSTIAIEAASERLRRLINKNIKEEQILEAVKISRENGLKGLKIYCMIGLPTETEDDIWTFIELARKIKTGNKGFNAEFSFSSFVPKPQTPFQWSRREDTKSLEKKQNLLKKELAKLGFDSKFSSAKWDYIQTILSRSGSEIAPVLVKVYKEGGKPSYYKKAIKELEVDISKSISGYHYDEVLPWDIIDSYPNKDMLQKEYNRLISL